MSLKEYQEKIIRQLITQEKLLARLYEVFSKQFTQSQKFWMKLSKEEQKHAKLIEKLLEAVKKKTVIYDEKKLKTYTLNTFITRLKNILQKAEAGEYTLFSALRVADDYESSLIEKNVFLHFDSFDYKIKNTLTMLHSETQKHAEMIKAAHNKFKKDSK